MYGFQKGIMAISDWQTAAGVEVILQSAMFVLSCLTERAVCCIPLLIVLLDWDYLACPRTFALFSACRIAVPTVKCYITLLWGRLSGRITSETRMTAKRRRTKRLSLPRRLILWCMWTALTLLSSSLAVIAVGSGSVPGFLNITGAFLVQLRSEAISADPHSSA